MENPKELIMASLSGEDGNMTPEVLKLMKRRITPESRLPPMEFLFQMFGVECFPRGELVAVTGKAKSGKTFFLSLLMAAYQGRVMWYDTEQSEQSTQDILVNRIMKMDGAEGVKGIANTSPKADELQIRQNLIHAFNTRGIGWEERRRLFAAGVAYLQPDLVIIDGVRDLISDINDGVEAQQVTEQLMALAQQHRCCIVCVLHQNKGDGDRNLRGWIGTELTNKVFEVYSCEKLRSSHTFKVEQTHTRRHEIGRELYYTVDAETGLPTACDKPVEQPRDAQGRWVSTKDLRRLFTEAMGGRSSRPFNEAMAVVMRLGQLTEKRQYYDLLREAEQIGIVRKETATDSGQQYVVLCDNELPF